MRWLPRLLELLFGAVLLAGVGTSVSRTVLVPRDRSSWLMRGALRVVLASGRSLLRRPLGRRQRPALLDLVLPVTLFVTLAGWLLGLVAGFFLLSLAAGVPADADGLAGTFLFEQGAGTDSVGRVVGLAAWGTAGLVIALWAACLPAIASAYGRRERLVRRLSSQALLPPDAENLLAAYVPDESGLSFNSLLAEWDAWFNDVRTTHAAYPALVAAPPTGKLCWLKAMVIMLDTAAVVEAVAPTRAVPYARALLQSGTACLSELVGQVRVVVPPMEVSLHGREEYCFPVTVERALQAGLPAERDSHRAREAFQSWRRRYAPHASAIAAYLKYESPPDDRT
jgi:hypothetical protein